MDFFPFTNKEEDSLHNYTARFQHVAPTFTQNMTMGQLFNFSIIHFLYLKNKSNTKYAIFFFWVENVISLAFLEARQECKKGRIRER